MLAEKPTCVAFNRLFEDYKIIIISLTNLNKEADSIDSSMWVSGHKTWKICKWQGFKESRVHDFLYRLRFAYHTVNRRERRYPSSAVQQKEPLCNKYI